MKKMFMKTGKKPGRDIIKSEKGFTLVEMVIVIAIVGIIVAICSGFIATYYKSVLDVQNNKSKMTELTSLKNAVDKWVTKYDCGFYDFTAENGTLSAAKAEGDNIPSTVYPSTLAFSNGNLTYTGKDNNGTDLSSVYPFSVIKSVGFALDGNLLVCEAGFGEGIEPQKIVFSLFSRTSRDRYASKTKVDLAKTEDTIRDWLAEYNSNTTISSIKVENGKLVAEVGSTGLLGFANPELSYNSTKKQLEWKKGLNISTETYYLLSGETKVEFENDDVHGAIICRITITTGSTQNEVYELKYTPSEFSKINKRG
ncbi:MAG: prepilin-type N-terminal cleavage/methylation domain-containing protein [Firmicutes bacterium]|nr:prepilin-type N-terminal cleavage/methylation domain-containing protein [Candidatus Colimorpha enterica]